MSKNLCRFLACAMIIGLVVVFASPADAGGLTKVPNVTAKDVPAQTVITTQYTGDFSDVHAAVQNLYRLAASQGYTPVDDSVTFVYLGDDRTADRITEIQIAVTAKLAQVEDIDPMDLERVAADFGLVTAKVKTKPPARVLGVTKDRGVSDPTDIYTGIYSYLDDGGFSPLSAPQEVFANGALIEEQCVYSELESEIQVAF